MGVYLVRGILARHFTTGGGIRGALLRYEMPSHPSSPNRRTDHPDHPHHPVPPAHAYTQQAFHTGWTNHGHNLTERFLRAADAVALAPAQHSRVPSAARLEELEHRLGHLFTHRKLLFLALTHPSACAQGSPNSKELSWMGDSALNLAITEQLAGSDIESVGKLTEARAQLVSRSNCAKSAKVFGLEEIMIIGKGVMTSNGGPTEDMLGASRSVCSVAGGPFLTINLRRSLDFQGRPWRPCLGPSMSTGAWMR